MEVNTSSISIKKWGVGVIALLLCFEFIIFPWLDWIKASQQELHSLKEIVNKQEFVLSSAEELENSSAQLAI